MVKVSINALSELLPIYTGKSYTFKIIVYYSRAVECVVARSETVTLLLVQAPLMLPRVLSRRELRPDALILILSFR